MSGAVVANIPLSTLNPANAATTTTIDPSNLTFPVEVVVQSGPDSMIYQVNEFSDAYGNLNYEVVEMPMGAPIFTGAEMGAKLSGTFSEAYYAVFEKYDETDGSYVGLEVQAVESFDEGSTWEPLGGNALCS